MFFVASNLHVEWSKPEYNRSEQFGFVCIILGELFAQLIGKHPLGLGAPEDVAAAILFLCQPAARWITGVDLSVDGGYTAH